MIMRTKGNGKKREMNVKGVVKERNNKKYLYFVEVAYRGF